MLHKVLHFNVEWRLTFLPPICNSAHMLIDNCMDFYPVHRAVPAGLAQSKVKIHLALSQEYPLWKALMDTHHYLAFLPTGRRRLRHIMRYEDFWLSIG